jgi:ABC-2 type transport system permease protein/lipopolysaccharide transport system permease protein
MADTEQISVYNSDRRKISLDSIYNLILEVIQYRHVLHNLISTTLKARYRRSIFGFLWSLLNPLFTMLILTVVFSSIYRSSFNVLGLYIMSGLLPWIMISNTMTNGCSSLVNAEGYLKKVYLPKQIFPMSVLGVEIVNFLLSLISLFVLALIFGARPNLSWLLLPFAIFLLAFFLLGIILAASVVTIYFRDFSHILQIGLTGMFYVTPIIYPLTLIAGTRLEQLIKLNPFFYFIEMFHQIIKDAIVPSAFYWLICLALAIASYSIGVLVFRFKENDIIYRL